MQKEFNLIAEQVQLPRASSLNYKAGIDSLQEQSTAKSIAFYN